MGQRRTFHPTRRAFIAGGAATGMLAAAAPSVAQVVSPGEAAPAKLPPPPLSDASETFHGIVVRDPFRLLEDSNHPDVKAWIEAQDQRGRAHLDALPSRVPIRKLFDVLLDYPRISIPYRRGTRYFNYFQDGLANQRCYGVHRHLPGPRQILIDPNTLSSDGTTSISDAFPDRLGQRVAYLLSEAGGDKQVLRVHDVEGNFDLRDTLQYCKHTSIAWHPNGRSFFYARYPAESDPAGWDRKSQVVFWHRLGQPQSADRVIFRLPAHRDVYLRVETSLETRLLKILARIGASEKGGYYVAPVDEPRDFTEIFPIGVASFWPLDSAGATHYALTTLNAPNGRLVRIDEADFKPDRWHTVIAEGEHTLDFVKVFTNRLVAMHLENLDSRVTVRDLNGRILSTVELGGPSRVWFGRQLRVDDHLLMQVDEQKRASRIEWLDLVSRKTTLFRATASKHDLSDAEVRRVTVTSKDGTRVPLSLIHRPGIALDGSTPTLLYAYGGFSFPQWPAYSETVAAWVRLGGVFALASIRGGGEFGTAWHDGGRLGRKQNSFDDFIAAAQWLIDNHYTRPDRLGINGASNGGLLVLATMLQRPELFGAVVSGVPVADMLRFKHFTFGSNWTSEYGDPANEADFKAMIAYSPVHNVRRGVKYPPLLILTADNDERVVPAHAYKIAAAIQREAPDAEVYMKVEQRAGHGFGNALSKQIDRATDTLAFLWDKLGGPVRQFGELAK
jgi:prolyl oligopeptidase